MTFLELARVRRSVRMYRDVPVEREKIDRCLEAARIAPSACNSQPWHFIVVDEPGLLAGVAAATFGPAISFNKFVPKAKAIIVAVAEASKAEAQIGAVLKNRAFNFIDTAIAVEHICLQAAEEGLGTCILGWFQEKKIKKLLGISGNRRIALLVTMGYPDAVSVDDSGMREKRRKKTQEIVSWNGFGKQDRHDIPEFPQTSL